MMNQQKQGEGGAGSGHLVAYLRRAGSNMGAVSECFKFEYLVVCIGTYKWSLYKSNGTYLPRPRYLTPQGTCTRYLGAQVGTNGVPGSYLELLLHSEWYNFVYLCFQSRGTHQTTAYWIGIRIGDWQYHPEKACSTQVPQHSSDGFCITTAQIKNIFVGNCKTVVMGFASLWPK